MLSYLIFKSKVFAFLLLSVCLDVFACAVRQMKFMKVYVGAFLVVQTSCLHCSSYRLHPCQTQSRMPKAMNFRSRILDHLFTYIIFCLYLHRQVIRHPESKIRGKKKLVGKKNLFAKVIWSCELGNDHFPFPLEQLRFSTDLSQPPCRGRHVDDPGHVILPKSAASPGPSFLPGSLSSGSRVPFHRPGLGLLSWPRWWVAVVCASSSVSAAGSICSLRPPFQPLLDHSICLSTRHIFSDSSLSSVQLSSSSGPSPEAQGVPSFPCR